jgi:hypothetical protein
MSKNFILKLSSIFIIGTILSFLIFGLYLGHKFYNSIFRLSSDQISDSLNNTVSQCKKIIDCELLPGDILIRRYITKRTWLVDKLAHPYFTHSAFYLGNNQIVEAVGTEKNSKDDIQIGILSKSDWLNFDVDNFVIIRPKNYSLKLDIIKSNLKNIAEDPDYIFGLPKYGNKKATCADLIFQQLLDEKIIRVVNAPNIITPDYLFSVAKNNPEDFEIIGFNIQK